MPDTRAIIARDHPALVDLVDEGVLVVHRRPSGYVERRSDGYREPELVFVVGTAHVSAKSADDVRRVVQAVQPECVVVELCRSRSALLAGDGGAAAAGGAQAAATSVSQQAAPGTQRAHRGAGDAAADGSGEECAEDERQRASSGAAASTSCAPAAQAAAAASAHQRRTAEGGAARPNPLGLSGSSSFLEVLGRTLSQGGQSGLVLRLLLAWQARRAADRLGVTAGGEFVAAAAAADASGAQLVLGDRPVEITLQRAWAALGWRRRAALLAELARGAAAPLPPELSSELVESLKSDGAVNALFAQLGERYPELISPLVTERDLYLAWSLKRSKAVNGARGVVGVIGKGHMPGVVYALRHDSGSLRFADLVGGANQKKRRRREQLQRLAVELVLGGAAYALWVRLVEGGQ